MSEVTVSIVVPVHNGATTLVECLKALTTQKKSYSEVIVVDDQSSDSSASIAREHGATVVETPQGRSGAGAARNVGAEQAVGEILVFLDADVVLQPGALERLLGPLEQGVDAAVGYYDGSAHSLGWLSGFKNTLIRARHRRSGARIRWFWTALGAITRRQFDALGGFDERHFTNASVEDMDLGYRLSCSGGTIEQVFDATISHRHQFDTTTIVKNDFRKSREWARMIARNGRMPRLDHGNTGSWELVALACSVLIPLGMLLSPMVPFALLVSMTACVGLAVLVRDEISMVRSERGIFSALAYLATRALLYPIAGIGALMGTVQGLREVQS